MSQAKRQPELDELRARIEALEDKFRTIELREAAKALLRKRVAQARHRPRSGV